MFTNQPVKYLKRSGHARLGSRHGWQKFAEVLYGGPDGNGTTPRPFRTSGALWGATGAPFYGYDMGILPREHHASVGRAAYVVYSYETPIAWLRFDGNDEWSWFMPDVKYSRTTSRHQSVIRTAICNPPETAGLYAVTDAA